MRKNAKLSLIAVGFLVFGMALWTGNSLAEGEGTDWAAGRFSGTREEVEQLVGYNGSIKLDAAQKATLDEALRALPAPCCSDFSAATCCCECNFARSTWGLGKYLISERGAGVEEVREAAQAWIETLYPSGYSGKACSRGRCNRPFKDDGCGGMSANRVILEP